MMTSMQPIPTNSRPRASMAPARARAWRKLGRNIMAPTVLVFALLIVWEALVHILATPTWLLPAPSQIVKTAVEQRDLLFVHTRQSLVETWLGLALALVSGTVLAFTIDFSPLMRRTLYPLLVTSQTVPIISIAPILIIWFGFGILPKIVVVALVCFFPIAINTADGLRSVDIDLVSLLRSMGANRWQIFSKVRLPAALPSFFSGLKIAVTYSVMGAVIGEWVGGSEGLGIFMLRSQHSYLTDQVFAAIAVTSFLSIAMFLVVMGMERILLPWHYTDEQSEVWEELGPPNQDNRDMQIL